MFGFRAAELDALFPSEKNRLVLEDSKTAYEITELCEILANCTAEVKGTYQCNFYQGQPCLSVHSFGKGKAWYIAAKAEQQFLLDFYRSIAKDAGVSPTFCETLPTGVVPASRDNVTFLQNFSMEEQTVQLTHTYHDLLHDTVVTDQQVMPVNGLLVLQPV